MGSTATSAPFVKRFAPHVSSPIRVVRVWKFTSQLPNAVELVLVEAGVVGESTPVDAHAGAYR